MSEKLEWLKEKHNVKREPKTAKTKSSKIIVKPEAYLPSQTAKEKQTEVLEKIETQLEENIEDKKMKKIREDELFKEAEQFNKRSLDTYEQVITLQKEKLMADLETSENYKKLSELVLKQAQEEWKDFQRKREKNIKEMEAQGVTVSTDSIFDTYREKALRGKKDEEES